MLRALLVGLLVLAGNLAWRKGTKGSPAWLDLARRAWLLSHRLRIGPEAAAHARGELTP